MILENDVEAIQHVQWAFLKVLRGAIGNAEVCSKAEYVARWLTDNFYEGDEKDAIRKVGLSGYE